jgi:hypothetical protein
MSFYERLAECAAIEADTELAAQAAQQAAWEAQATVVTPDAADAITALGRAVDADERCTLTVEQADALLDLLGVLATGTVA